jgi:sugar phosphate isomerase/epimerase
MEYGFTVGRFVDRLADVPDDVPFAELAIGEGDLPLDDLDPRTVRDALPDDVQLTVHLPFRQPLATGVPEFDVAVREYLSRVLGAAATCGADAAVCHATARDPEEEAQRAALGESMRAVAASGHERDVAVHFENLGQLDGGVGLGTLATLAGDADVELCFDIGHAVMETGYGDDDEAIRAFVEAAADRITYLHVHDVRARGDSHIPVGSGEVDIAWVAGLLREAGFDGRAAIEVFSDDLAFQRDAIDRFDRAYSER